jgi:hypothetical protein
MSYLARVFGFGGEIGRVKDLLGVVVVKGAFIGGVSLAMVI